MLTLGQAKLKFARYASEEDLVPRINAACEALLTALNHKNSIDKVAFTVTDGILTLPSQYLTCLGVTIEEIPRPIFNRWFEFVDGGPGISDTPCTEVIDLGDGYCTTVDVPEDGSVITVISELAEDAGLEILIRGLDTTSLPIYTTKNGRRIEGEWVDIAVSPGANTSSPFLSISQVVKPVTKGRVYLYADDTLLATYFPNERVPRYRRYRVPNHTDGTDVVTLCLRRHVDLVDDNDAVPIENFNALRDAMLSLQYRDNNDLERSQEYLSSALAFLNKEHKRTNPAGHYPPMVSFPGQSSIPNLR